MYHLDFSVCFVALILLNSESVAVNEKRGFIYCSEGSNAERSCESKHLYHQWYQGYKKSAIGCIPLQKGIKKTHYNITVEKFDNNTQIYCKNDENGKNRRTSKNLDVLAIFNFDPSSKQYFVTSIQLIESLTPIKEPKILKYSKTRKDSFSCEEYVNETNNTIYLGVINTTSNTINTHELKSVLLHKNFNETHNGTTILCCLYYEVSESDEEKWINRHIVKKSMLIYDDDIWNDALNGPDGNQTIIIYVSAAVVVILILLVVIVICKKCCRKAQKSDSKVQYVDLDIIRTEPGSLQRPRPEDESPYAQIIGVMRPETNLGKAK